MSGEKKKLGELAAMVGGELAGDPELVISGVADLADAGPGDISFVADARRAAALGNCRASALIVPLALAEAPLPSIRVRNPYLAVAQIHGFFLTEPFVATGIDARAVVGRDCEISAEVAIGPLVAIGNRVRIGRRVTIHPGVVLYDDVILGDDVVLHANVTICQGCHLGSRVIIHSGAVIGSDGFGYATDSQGRHLKRPQVGIVRIEDDVEIGANTAIDRATFGTTLVRRGTKIDNLVQIGHNVEIGEDSFLVAQVGIAGSTTTGRGVIIGGQTGVSGHIHLGDRVMVAAKSGVHNDLPPGAVIAGIPGITHKTWLRASAAYARLPELVKEIRELKKKVAALSSAGGEPGAGDAGDD